MTLELQVVACEITEWQSTERNSLSPSCLNLRLKTVYALSLFKPLCSAAKKISGLIRQSCSSDCRLWIMAVLTDLTGCGSLLDLMVSRCTVTVGWSRLAGSEKRYWVENGLWLCHYLTITRLCMSTAAFSSYIK